MYRQNYPDDPGMHNSPRAPGHYGDQDQYIGRDSNTQVRYTRDATFGERIRNSLVAILVGIVLICSACGLLFWNEGRAVQTAKSLDEGLRSVRTLQNTDVIFDENSGKLIHLVGPLHTSKILHDEQYGIAVQAVHLRRKVQMYQWVETEHKSQVKEGDVTREEIYYSYSLEWRSEIVRSSSFHNPTGHQNANLMPVTSWSVAADDTQVGSFYLSTPLISKITNYKQLVVKEAPTKQGVHLHFGTVYHGRDPMYPVVGDLQVTFEYAGRSGKSSSQLGPPDTVSVIGKQGGNEVLAYQTAAGDDLQFLYMGDYSAEKMFSQEQANNTMMTWAARFAGWLLMFIGFSCLTSIIGTLVDWIPIVREVIGLGVVTMNVALAISLSLTVIALGWITYRPWLGITILVMAFSPFILSKIRQNRQGHQTHRGMYD